MKLQMGKQISTKYWFVLVALPTFVLFWTWGTSESMRGSALGGYMQLIAGISLLAATFGMGHAVYVLVKKGESASSSSSAKWWQLGLRWLVWLLPIPVILWLFSVIWSR